MTKKEGGENSVTGLSKPVSGFGNLEEDTIYSNLGGWEEVEGELSNKFFIITRRNPEAMRRSVMAGKFKYKKEGVMTSAKIRTRYTFNISWDGGEETIGREKSDPKTKRPKSQKYCK